MAAYDNSFTWRAFCFYTFDFQEPMVILCKTLQWDDHVSYRCDFAFRTNSVHHWWTKKCGSGLHIANYVHIFFDDWCEWRMTLSKISDLTGFCYIQWILSIILSSNCRRRYLESWLTYLISLNSICVCWCSKIFVLGMYYDFVITSYLITSERGTIRGELLLSSMLFRHLSWKHYTEVTQFVSGLYHSRHNLDRFKHKIRSFLV